MNLFSTLAYLENAEFVPYRHISHREEQYQEQIELERLSMPAPDVEEIELGIEEFNKLFKQTGGLASLPALPSVSEQVTTPFYIRCSELNQYSGVTCTNCSDFTRCIKCDRLSHWSRSQGAQS